MGTRGVVGTLKDGVLHASYQQFDTYPTSTGVELQTEMQETLDSIGENTDPGDLFPFLAQLVSSMTYVEADKKPTEADMAKFADSLDTRVSTGDDWYALLRKHQGSLMKRLNAGIATEDTAFVKDSLFCEWGYVFDFDAQKVLVLRGFNTREDKQWEHARLSPAQKKAQVDKSKRQPPGQRDVYYGVSVLWTGTMEEFLKVDMTALEAIEVDA